VRLREKKAFRDVKNEEKGQKGQEKAIKPNKTKVPWCQFHQHFMLNFFFTKVLRAAFLSLIFWRKNIG